jgi:P27 family predicted phage terminase small subunit
MTQRASTRLKLLRGTQRSDRRPKKTAGEVLARVPPAPPDMSPFGIAEWRRLAPIAVELAVLTRADLRGFALLCEVLASETQLRDQLQLEGLTIPCADGSRKAHPAVAMLARTRALASKMLDSFGLTPRGRQSVDILPPKKKSRLAAIDDELFSGRRL